MGIESIVIAIYKICHIQIMRWTLKTFGRKPTLTAQPITHARQLLDQGQTVQDVAALVNVHRMTIYCALATQSSGVCMDSARGVVGGWLRRGTFFCYSKPMEQTPFELTPKQKGLLAAL